MAGHGGARVGSGRPEGGISATKRLLLAGLRRGLAYAARTKGLDGEEEELATETVARIASDLILAGQGRDVLAILAQAAPKSDDGAGDPGKESPLVAALRRLPGMVGGPESARAAPGHAETQTNTEPPTPGPTDTAFVPPAAPPFFAPQVPLLPPVLEPAPPGPRAARAPAPGGPPTPGVRPPVPGIYPGTEKFEKNPDAPEHTEHCQARQRWGDGECECGAAGRAR